MNDIILQEVVLSEDERLVYWNYELLRHMNVHLTYSTIDKYFYLKEVDHTLDGSFEILWLAECSKITVDNIESLSESLKDVIKRKNKLYNNFSIKPPQTTIRGNQTKFFQDKS